MKMQIDEFGKKLIEQVRDQAISSREVLGNPYSKSPARLRLNQFDEKCVDHVLDVLVPELIDETLFYLLRSIDGGHIRLLYVADDGQKCDLEADGLGELAGWLNGEDGWVERYSKFKLIEPLSGPTATNRRLPKMLVWFGLIAVGLALMLWLLA